EFRRRFSSSPYSLSLDGDFDHNRLDPLTPHGSRLSCAPNRNESRKWDDITTASHLFQRIIVGIHQTVDTALQKSSSVGTK
ncbi:unnamed protein product, partial [Brassica oleracea var. botrytis]